MGCEELVGCCELEGCSELTDCLELTGCCELEDGAFELDGCEELAGDCELVCWGELCFVPCEETMVGCFEDDPMGAPSELTGSIKPANVHEESTVAADRVRKALTIRFIANTPNDGNHLLLYVFGRLY